jgi:3-oxoacyl-[acyl-carrier-protein] synthase II
MMVLEREDRARARGATVYASIDGYGSTCDAYHRVQMAPDGVEIVRAMELALERSGRAKESIGYVNYHGTSTVLNDAVESRCVRQALRRSRRAPGGVVDEIDGRASAGASGGAGIVSAALAIQRGFLPPTINQTEPDPGCDLDYLPNHGRHAEVEAALCNCLGFGSKNSAVVIGRCA